ncbi:hypothetical protein T8S45_01645 [Blastomonas marina]|nr:hypothetical protein [Blastomonas marina]WPZ04261.1 hypothetical protein T8S45_01645 [Blastomonas marina]
MVDQANTTKNAKKAFIRPELHQLDISRTATGPFPDPSEFPMILQMS